MWGASAMSTSAQDFEIRSTNAIANVSADAWNALAGEGDLFTEHGFLQALELSESVGLDAGWLPHHLLVYDGTMLAGAMPLYIKTNSFGEFIFDFAWAQGAMRAGIPYYPKLVSAIPFTPATGKRILVHPKYDALSMRAACLAYLRSMLRTEGAHSLHILFLTKEESVSLSALGMLTRTSMQYHWDNRSGWTSFEDYLASFRSSHRKQVRKERARACSPSLECVMKTGEEMTKEEWQALYPLYLGTIDKRGSEAYLTQAFFEQLQAGFKHRVAASFAYRGNDIVAGSLFLYKGSSLYGRYWGSFEPLEYLHFELCYYLPIEWGIARGITHIEAGAQGEHKIKRGFLPTRCFSMHRFNHPALERGVAEFLKMEAAEVEHAIDVLTAHSPFHIDRSHVRVI